MRGGDLSMDLTILLEKKLEPANSILTVNLFDDAAVIKHIEEVSKDKKSGNLDME
jgi:hypothetical protein